MSEKELLEQLNNLKNIKPDHGWKERNRQVLLSQIYGAEPAEAGASRGWMFKYVLQLSAQAARSVSQPAVAVAFILLFMLGGGVFSLYAAQGTKPGDSLYIAKIISEKAQQAFTFDERAKARLGIEFAGNRAKELSQVLAERDENEEKEVKVEQLVNDFRKEIEVAKTRIEKMAPRPSKEPAPAEEAVAEEETPETAPEAAIKEDEADEPMFFTADLGKDERGIEISDEGAGGNEESAPVSEGEEEENIGAVAATGTDEAMSASSTAGGDLPADGGVSEPEKILKQAEMLLDNENYDETLNKLNEAGEAIGRVNAGQVKGESVRADEEGENTTSTEGTEEGGEDGAASSSPNG